MDESHRYALFKNCADPQISCDEMRYFLGILILSRYDEKPGKRFYWDSEGDLTNTMVANSMRRDRFTQIMRFIHYADNTQMDSSDKAWKVRLLMNKIKLKCLQYFVPEEH